MSKVPSHTLRSEPGAAALRILIELWPALPSPVELLIGLYRIYSYFEGPTGIDGIPKEFMPKREPLILVCLEACTML